jgi:hypothetical protein
MPLRRVDEVASIGCSYIRFESREALLAFWRACTELFGPDAPVTIAWAFNRQITRNVRLFEWMQQPHGHG